MKNLYAINDLYVDDSTEISQIGFIFALNDEECYNHIKEAYGFMSDDKEELMENQGEIGLHHDDYDSYYNETIYGWSLVLENVTLDEAKDYILKDQLAII